MALAIYRGRTVEPLHLTFLMNKKQLRSSTWRSGLDVPLNIENIGNS